MANKKHPYDDGEIIRDIKNKEVFVFTNKRDGFKAEQDPGSLRPANDEEKGKLDESGQDYIKLNL